MKSKVRSEPGSVNGVTQCGRRSEEGDLVNRGRVPRAPPPPPELGEAQPQSPSMKPIFYYEKSDVLFLCGVFFNHFQKYC